MKFTFSWLKEHLETSASVAEIAQGLNMIGLEVSEIVDSADKLGAFTIAKVVSAEKHPNADKLKVLMVDPGDGSQIQIICGAPNARDGMLGVLAKPGDHIPGLNTTLTVGTIRDVESRGMLCSERELEISDEHEGIIELPEDAPIGESFVKYAGLDDPVIEIDLNPNRPDCTGIHGIARDLAAAGFGTLKEFTTPSNKTKFPCPIEVKLEFGNSESLCPAFALRSVKGISNGPSPQWLQNRITAIGLRPINKLVDITNYITFEFGRPLHVFDAKKVKGNLIVRRGKLDESFLALDGKEYKVDKDICVIADDKGIESLSGIMGGELSGCDDETTEVLIESALWVPENIAQTGRKLGIISDARYRFERGVDPNFMVPGIELATKMVIDLCGGEPSEITIAGDVPSTKNVIDFPLSEIKRLSGLDVLPTEAKEILTNLGFQVSGSTDELKVNTPSWRPDIFGKADLVEEVMRITGIDKVPSTPLPRLNDVGEKVLTLSQIRRNKARRAFAIRGFNEAITWSFIAKSHAEMFGGGNANLTLTNPISSELSDMRPSLIPGLLSACQRNSNRGFTDIALFEVGQVFLDDEPDGQLIHATGIRQHTSGLSGAGRHWSGSAENVSVFDAKADTLSILESLGAPVDNLQVNNDAPNWYHPGRSGTLKLGPKTILANFGEIHPKILRELDIKVAISVFEIMLDNIPEPRDKKTKSKGALKLSDQMSVNRDFAFVVDKSVNVEKVIRAAKNADKKLIDHITLFDIYQGQGIDTDKKSVAINVSIQPQKHTLTDKEIDTIGEKIIESVEKATGGLIRQ